ncbi:hypothetical protein RU95_GL001554 [Enterococcus avium]|nr:hypothetical protein RU95_GL001554 [Enterococcus avium]
MIDRPFKLDTFSLSSFSDTKIRRGTYLELTKLSQQSKIEEVRLSEYT